MDARAKKAVATVLVLAPLAVFGLLTVGPWWTLGAFCAVAVWELAKYAVRRLRAASARIDQIFADELDDRPDTNGETR